MTDPAFPIADVIEAMADFLRNFPASGQVPSAANEIAATAVYANLIERHEIKKSCTMCGTARPDYSFFKITPAGRFFLAALSPAQPVDETERLREAIKQAEIHIDCAHFRKAQDILRAALQHKGEVSRG